jgi:hypothetical protein
MAEAFAAPVIRQHRLAQRRRILIDRAVRHALREAADRTA